MAQCRCGNKVEYDGMECIVCYLESFQTYTNGRQVIETLRRIQKTGVWIDDDGRPQAIHAAEP